MFGGRGLAMVTRYRGGLGAAALVVAIVGLGLLERFELAAFDRLFEFRGARPPTAPIVIVSMDESTFVEIGEQWPFPRAMHAKLLDAIAAGHPLDIGVDVLFALPSLRGTADDAA